MSALTDRTRRTAARVAAAGYIALFVLAIFANFTSRPTTRARRSSASRVT